MFEYDLDYAFEATPEPVSLRLPVDANHRTFTRWPAFFYDLIPQGRGRKFLLGQLGLVDGPQADFALVRAGAFNPIGRVRLTPLFDFAPMYLDPEGIARASRWYHPVTKKELTAWRDVIAALALDDGEAERITSALRTFGEKMHELVAYMQQAGVDDDIIAFLRPNIEEQIRQLRSMGEAE